MSSIIARGNAAAKLRLEMLEDRTVPSVIATRYNHSTGNTYHLLASSTWIAAENEAIGLGGHLVTINNVEENTWVFDTFTPLTGVSRPALWIGLNDAASEGEYVWSSGDDAGFRYWADGEPNNGAFGAEDYVHLIDPLGGTDRRGRWNDRINVAAEGGLVYFGVVEVEPQDDIHVQTAKLQNATTVQFTYETAGDPGAFEVGVYRSADEHFDATTDLRVDGTGAFTTITPAATSGTQTGTIALAKEIPIDPRRPYVLVVADPQGLIDESSEANNDDGHFRKLVLGAVTHGYQPPLTQMGAWVTQIADSLKSRGYDSHTIPFDWAEQSRRLRPNQAVHAGNRLAADIRDAVNQMQLGPNDVVDLHLIGHSRGSVVISQALFRLEQYLTPGRVSPLKFGYMKMTMLDPHPANNAFIPSFAPDSNLAAIAGLLYSQSIMSDPNVVVSRIVDSFEHFYQRSLTLGLSPLSPDYYLNLWGELPSEIVNNAPAALNWTHLIPSPASHTTVTDWYMAYILPLI